MNAPLSASILSDLIREEKLRRAAEASLMDFTRAVWHVIEPAEEFRHNWHLDAIAEHLEAVTRGEIKNLVIAIPPGCMKSILVSVAWPAWMWIKRPDLRIMGASYGIDLAIRDSQKCRDIITSEWYQRHWGDKVAIRPGEDQKTKYALSGGGWRMATSVGGRATGEHPDVKLVDDPHNQRQSDSDTERENAITWFDRTLSTRGKSRGAKTVVVAQRFHERDVTGHILADLKGYDYLCIPMEFEHGRKATSLGWVDPRTEKGELLWPEMFNEESVAELKQALGDYGTAGQLQQEPAPAEGGIINTGKIQMWSKDESSPPMEYILQSYDTAFTEKTSGDPTACTVWGVFRHKGRYNAMLLDAWDEHMAYPQLRAKVLDDFSLEYKANSVLGAAPVKSRKADRVLIEQKGSGQSLLQDLRQGNVPVVGYNPGNADKIARAHQATPIIDRGLVWIPESTKNPGNFVSWAAGFIKQLSRFPVAEHDDYVDTFTQAMIFLKDQGWFDLQRAKDRENEGPPPEKPVNPYAE